MGAIFLGFMTLIVYEIVHGGVPAASKNLGW
jgi:hypothetical protein